MKGVPVTQRPQDRCDGCTHAFLQAIHDLEHLLCRAPQVLAAFGRERIAAGLARDDICRGRLWRPLR